MIPFLTKSLPIVFAKENYNEYLNKNPKSTTLSPIRQVVPQNIEVDQNDQDIIQAYNQTLSHDAPVSKTELIILEQILSYPDFILAKQMSEILDLIDHFEVKRLIQWLKKIYLEIDESDYKNVLHNKLSSINKNDLKETIVKALNKHSRLKLENEIVEKTMKDFAKKLRLERLRRQKEEFKQMQKDSSTEQESQDFLNKILEVEKEIRNVKFNS